MDFLKEVLGDDFEAFKEKVERFNEKSEKPLKLANLSEGGYVSREKFDALNAQMEKIGEESAKVYKEEIESLKAKMADAENSHAIDMLIKGMGAKNLKAVKALLDLKSPDAEPIEKQLEIIRSENDYLFEKQVSGGATGMRQGSAGKDVSAQDELRQKLFGK